MLRMICIGALLIVTAAGAHAQAWETVDVPEAPGLFDLGMEDGILWISTQGRGLVGYDGTQWVAHIQADGGIRRDSWNYNLLVDSAGRKWMTRDDTKAVDRLDDAGTFGVKNDDTWTYYDSHEALSASRIFSAAEASEGAFWFGVRDENHNVLGTVDLLIDNSDTTTVDDEWYHYDNYLTPGQTFFSDDDVRELAIDEEGRLWIGYNAAGVDVWEYADPATLDDDVWEHHTKETVLPSDSISALHVGTDGRVWVATLGGLAVHDPSDGSWLTIEGLPGLQVQAVYTDAHGHAWVATNDGVAMLYVDGSVASVYDTDDGLHDANATDLIVDRGRGVVWVVTKDALTGDDHLNRFESGIVPGIGKVYAYPNPWREAAGLTEVTLYGVPNGSLVDIFDITGQRVRELPAREPYFWDTLDDESNEVPSGVYVIRVRPSDGSEILVKAAVVR